MGQELNTSESPTGEEIEDVHLFLPVGTVGPLTKQIRQHLSAVTKSSGLDAMNKEMTEALQPILERLTTTNTDLKVVLQAIVEKQAQLQTAYATQRATDLNASNAFFASSDEIQVEQFGYFAVQAFMSMFLMLLKCVEKNEPTIVHQMLQLTNRLIEQVPLTYFFSSGCQRSSHLFKSLQPLVNYIQELLQQTPCDRQVSNRAIEILLKLSVISGSLSETLAVVRKLLFNITDIFDLRKLFAELNKTIPTERVPSRPLEYLESIGVFPSTRLATLPNEQLTGQFISSVLIAHLDLHSQCHVESQFERNSLEKSFSFDFHPKIFTDLYAIIADIKSADLDYLLTATIRLFTAHLRFFVSGNFNAIDGIAEQQDVDTWFTLMLDLASNHPSDEIKSESSKAIVLLLDSHTRSFGQTLAFIDTHIRENKHPILIKLLIEKLTNDIFIQRWIEALSDDHPIDDRSFLYRILHDWLDADKDDPRRAVLPRFQQLLFIHLQNQSTDIQESLEPSALSTLLLEYANHVIQSTTRDDISDVLLEPFLHGLCVLTDAKFNFALTQPTFTALVPSLADPAVAQHRPLVSWLLSKILQRLIIGPPASPLEKKYATTLQSPLYAGGYETTGAESSAYLSSLFQSKMAIATQMVWPNQDQQDSSIDNDLLLAIYNQTDVGAQLIAKMKRFTREKPRPLQKSLESYASEASAALFAVYVKHFRRVNLATHELTRPIDQKPHGKLLSLFDHANQIQLVFATTKARGGDCEQLFRQIRSDALSLLVSVKASPFISLIKEDLTTLATLDRPPVFQRQKSRWTKALIILRLLRNVMRACVRLKYLMLARKEAVEQKKDNESVLHQTIVTCLYGNALSTSTESIHLQEILQCLIRQHQRAMTRLLTYRFLARLIATSDDQSTELLLSNCKGDNLQWHPFEHISAANYQCKEAIGEQYYSIAKQMSLSSTPSTLMRVFDLLNLSYNTRDLCHLHQSQLLDFILLHFTDDTQPKTKQIAYNTFRLFTLQLCENIELEQMGTREFHHILQEQRQTVFHRIIFTQLQQEAKETTDRSRSSLKATLNFDSDDRVFPCLMLLLRCVHAYEHIRRTCATIDYIRLLLDLYEHNTALVTRLLALRILREILPDLPHENNQSFIENLLKETLSSIGASFHSTNIDLALIIEWISIFRTFLCRTSAWQPFATQLIITALQWKPDSDRTDALLASLAVLGGHVRPFCLGSAVEIFDAEQTGVIIEIDAERDATKPYVVQNAQTNQIESTSPDQLRILSDVLPPNLLLLPIDNAAHLILDALGSLAQMDTDSSLLLQIKRRAVSALYPLLNHKALVEIFMRKPYARLLATLAMPTPCKMPADLRCFNRFHLEQYSLSLDTCERIKQITDDPPDAQGWNKQPVVRHSSGQAAVSDEIRIVPTPADESLPPLEECGEKHKFLGRVNITDDSSSICYPSFIMDNVQLAEGKWYYCVRLPLGEATQIGWATTGFAPAARSSQGVGEDRFSWSYDGSRGCCFLSSATTFAGDTRWKAGDVCGCGIDINGNNTQLDFWLNGTHLGTVASQTADTEIEPAAKCDLLPNGLTTTYFPAVTVRVYGSAANTGVFEFIFSPDDMSECPLPNGYRSLLSPSSSNMKNTLAPYPNHAFLVGSDPQQFFHTAPPTESTSLRDFVNDQHVEMPSGFETGSIDGEDKHLLRLPADKGGLPLTITNSSSLTISFEFEISSSDLSEIVLFAVENTPYPIAIPPADVFLDETMPLRQRVAILFQSNEATKVYVNNTSQLLPHRHNGDVSSQATFTLQLLPNVVDVRIVNVGVWKSLLSEEDIRRLFIYGLSYVAADYQALDKHRKQSRALVFTAENKSLIDEILVPTRSDLISFAPIPNTDRLLMRMFGNESYVTIDTAGQQWSEYTVILDISIPLLPDGDGAKLNLLTIDADCGICIASDGHLCLSNEQRSSSPLLLEKDVRLAIVVRPQRVQIYVNGALELDHAVNDKQFSTKLKHIDLFRQSNSNEQICIGCRGITFLPLAINARHTRVVQLLKSVELTLDSLVAPSFELVSNTLVAIGHSEESIRIVLDHFPVSNIHSIDVLLRERADEIERIRRQTLDDKEGKVLTRLNIFNESPLFPTTLSSSARQLSEEKANDVEWFDKAFSQVGLSQSLSDWLKDKSKSKAVTGEPSLEKLADHDETTNDNDMQTTSKQSCLYVHEQVPRTKFLQSRQSCENGLVMIYARYTVLNILKVWNNDDQSTLFPLSHFGDESFIVVLLKLMNHHYENRRTRADEAVDRMRLVAAAILKGELKQLLKCSTNERVTKDLLRSQAPLLFQLQKHVVDEVIRCQVQLSTINMGNAGDAIDEASFIEQPQLDFPLKIVRLLAKFLTDEEMKKFDIDRLIGFLFPPLLLTVIFDLFLLIPFHRGKIIILGLFTTLIRASKNVQLHRDIQDFVEQLNMELTTKDQWSTSIKLKSFRQALMDLLVVVWKRQQQRSDVLLEHPSDVNHLLSFVTSIDRLTTHTLGMPWPEALIAQSTTILGETLALTNDMLESAQQYFNTIADEQLMQFMNANLDLEWTPLPHDAVQQWLASLPNESTVRSSCYSVYSHLYDLPSNQIRARAVLLYIFNLLLDKILPAIDLRLPAGSSFLTDRIRSVRAHILFTCKYHLFTDALTKTEASGVSTPTVQFDTVRASLAEKPEDTMFSQAFQQLYADASKTFRRAKDERVWSATFTGMHSTDAGGPYRDSITRICADLCSSRLPLFVLCPNGRMNDGANRDRWIPNTFPPAQPITAECRNQYRFVGQLMGMAIRTRNYLDVRFPALLWKQLVHDTVTIKDIEAIDVQSFTIINQMEENIQQVDACSASDEDEKKENLDYLFDSVMNELTFEVVSSAGQTYELIPGGRSIPINALNFEHYCLLYNQHRLHEFDRQINFIRQGLYSIVPADYLTLYTAVELEEAVCGSTRIDVDMLKRHTNYASDNETTPHIQLFWTVLSEMFTEEQKKLFLIFVWGRTTLPSRDQDFTTSFTINRLEPSGDVNQQLPKSHTCFFGLDLPPYTTKEATYERLNYAITYCSSIDGDGSMN